MGTDTGYDGKSKKEKKRGQLFQHNVHETQKVGNVKGRCFSPDHPVGTPHNGGSTQNRKTIERITMWGFGKERLSTTVSS